MSHPNCKKNLRLIIKLTELVESDALTVDNKAAIRRIQKELADVVCEYCRGVLHLV